MFRHYLLTLFAFIAVLFPSSTNSATFLINSYTFEAGGGPPPAGNPCVDISGCVLWLDAADTSTITESSGLVSQIDDKSVSGYDATQPTLANQPITGTRTLNGNNVLDIQVDDYLALTAHTALLDILGNDNHTIFVVASVDDNTASRSIVRGMNGTNNTRYFLGIRPTPTVEVTFNTTTTSYNGAMSTGDAHIMAATKSVGGAPSAKFIFGGNVTTGLGTDAAIVNLGIGRRTNSATEQWDGTFAEILVFNRVLTTDEINEVGDYLSVKWDADWTEIPFTPTDVTNIETWLDAADTSTIVHTSNSVSQWTDKTGLGQHATQGTGTNQPTTNTRTMNGLNVIDFDGTDDRLFLGTGFRSRMSGSAGYTIFAVYQSDITTGIQTLYGMNNGGSTILQYNLTSAGLVMENGGSLTLNYTVHTNPFVTAYRRNGVNRLLANDDSEATDTGGVDSTFNNAVALGYSPQGTTKHVNGVFAEFIVYTRALTSDEINQIGQYLADKWGISWTDVSFNFETLPAYAANDNYFEEEARAKKRA